MDSDLTALVERWRTEAKHLNCIRIDGPGSSSLLLEEIQAIRHADELAALLAQRAGRVRRGCGGPPLCYDPNCQLEDGHG